jgi:hypothetical protein
MSNPHLTNNANELVFKHAKTDYVVLIELTNGKCTVLMDPGLNRVWKGQGVFGKKFGDSLAAEAQKEPDIRKAACVTWEHAYAHLLKEAGGESSLEHHLFLRAVQRQQARSNVVNDKPSQA